MQYKTSYTFMTIEYTLCIDVFNFLSV